MEGELLSKDLETTVGSDDFHDALDETISQDSQLTVDDYVTSPETVDDMLPEAGADASREGVSPLLTLELTETHVSSDSSSSDEDLDNLPTPHLNRRERARFSERRKIQRETRPPRKLTYNQKGQPSYYR